jgi:hypothetical protein
MFYTIWVHHVHCLYVHKHISPYLISKLRRKVAIKAYLYWILLSLSVTLLYTVYNMLEWEPNRIIRTYCTVIHYANIQELFPCIIYKATEVPGIEPWSLYCTDEKIYWLLKLFNVTWKSYSFNMITLSCKHEIMLMVSYYYYIGIKLSW